MGQTRKKLGIAFFLLLWIINGSQVSAMNSGYTSESIPKDKQVEIAASIDVRLLKAEPKKLAIECFDVNENGLIAIGSEGNNPFESNTISVYSDVGDFQYGYQFRTDGIFYLEWAGEDIIIHFVRGDWAVLVNSDGEVEEIREVPSTLEYDKFRRNVLKAKKKQINNRTYYLKNDMGILNLVATNYSQLWYKEPDNTEVLLYDVNAAQFRKKIVWSIGIFLFMGLVFYTVGREFVKLRKNEESC